MLNTQKPINRLYIRKIEMTIFGFSWGKKYVCHYIQITPKQDILKYEGISMIAKLFI